MYRTFPVCDDGDSICCYINTGNNKIKKKSLNNIPVLLPFLLPLTASGKLLHYSIKNFLSEKF